MTNDKSNKTTIQRNEIEGAIVKIIEEMDTEWDNAFASEIGPQTRLSADLELDSMQLVQLVVRIEKHFKLKSLPFHELLLSEENVKDDLKIVDVVEFMERVLNRQ